MDVLDRSVASKGHPITAPSLASVAEVREPLDRLLAYCARHDWAGYDPYDALNSRVFNATPFARNRYCRIAITQFLKRLPINLRVPLQVPRRQNPKGLALFLSAVIRLDRAGALADPTLIGRLADRLVATRSTGTRYWCWGYSFPWQTRTVVVPVGAPNLVCTAFVADALLDLFQANGDRRHLEMAVSAAEDLLNDLYWQDGNVAGFSYPLPRLRTQVHNANLLAAAVLCRVAAETGARQLVDPALRAARHSAAAQAPDGSWDYGQSSTQKWVDNFHTGFNLGALQSLGRSLKSDEFEPNVRAGFGPTAPGSSTIAAGLSISTTSSTRSMCTVWRRASSPCWNSGSVVTAASSRRIGYFGLPWSSCGIGAAISTTVCFR